MGRNGNDFFNNLHAYLSFFLDLCQTYMSQNNFPLRLWQLIWYICILIFGFAGNGIVIYVTFKAKDIQRDAPFNAYLVTLSIVDLSISVIATPIYILSTSTFDHPSGTVGEWLCKICTNYFVIFYLIRTSIFLLCAIAIERRKAIVQPFSILQETSLCKTLGVIFFIFVLGLFTQSPTMYRAHYSETNGTIGNACVYNPNSTDMIVLHFVSFFFNCVIPTFIIFLCFHQINKHLSKTLANFRSLLGAYENSANHENIVQEFMKKRKRTIDLTKLMVFVFLVFVCIDEVFYLILHPVTNFTSVEWNSSIFQVALMLRISNSFMNPILFAFKSKNFRRRLRNTIGISSTCKYHNGECPKLFCVKCKTNREAYHNIHES